MRCYACCQENCGNSRECGCVCHERPATEITLAEPLEVLVIMHSDGRFYDKTGRWLDRPSAQSDVETWVDRLEAIKVHQGLLNSGTACDLLVHGASKFTVLAGHAGVLERAARRKQVQADFDKAAASMRELGIPFTGFSARERNHDDRCGCKSCVGM